jgi:hypothetical protein
VGPRAGLDVCEKSRPYRDSIPEPSSPYSVAIPTELPGSLSKTLPTLNKVMMKCTVHYIVHLQCTVHYIYIYSVLYTTFTFTVYFLSRTHESKGF